MYRTVLNHRKILETLGRSCRDDAAFLLVLQIYDYRRQRVVDANFYLQLEILADDNVDPRTQRNEEEKCLMEEGSM